MPAAWDACREAGAVRSIAGTLVRVVESQEHVATTQLVGTLDEQALLEEMLEAAKPAPRPGSEGLHYLLMTPFRYPPLRHGSRFGGPHEPSLLYGSLAPDTALAECAYYRLVFWSGMATPPAGPIRTRHTLFRAAYASEHGARLQRPPCDAHRIRLAHPADYAASQALGTAMRATGVLAFEFRSARDPQGGDNVALFEPAALADEAPHGIEEWLCELHGEQVTFLRPPGLLRHFPAAAFRVDGVLPHPAT